MRFVTHQHRHGVGHRRSLEFVSHIYRKLFHRSPVVTLLAIFGCLAMIVLMWMSITETQVPYNGENAHERMEKSSLFNKESYDRGYRDGYLVGYKDGNGNRSAAVATTLPIPTTTPSSSSTTTTSNAPVSSDLWSKRRDEVRAAIKSAWDVYEKHCFGRDEVKPVSKQCSGDVIWLDEGLTLIDSMDTLHLVGLRDEYEKAETWVLQNLDFDRDRKISLFESTIRIVGGLLSAYELSRNRRLLEKLDDYAARIAPIFNSSSGFPYAGINLRTSQTISPRWTGGSSLLSEVGSLQLEYMYLVQHLNTTATHTVFTKADKVVAMLESMESPYPGLYPTFIDTQTGRFSNNLVTYGAMADSFYEYLLKVWLISGKTAERYRRMYERAVDGMEKWLLHEDGGWMYLGDVRGSGEVRVMDHLVCFVPGLLALGVHHMAVRSSEARVNHMRIARGLMRTCAHMYFNSASGLAGEDYSFNDQGMHMRRRSYRLRPETVESLFVMYRVTGESQYREWGYKIFSAIQRHCKLPDGGYSGVTDVTMSTPRHSDFMESFFIAETLKYAYLLFSPTNVVSLDEYVFNTEAHPLRPIHPSP